LIATHEELTQVIISLGNLGLRSNLTSKEREGILKEVCQLKIKCIDQIPGEIPSVGIDGLATAKRFWFDGFGKADDLRESQISCLRYLTRESADVVPRNPEHFAIRAIMCVLHDDYSPNEYWLGIHCFSEYLHSSFGTDADSIFSDRISQVVESFLKTR